MITNTFIMNRYNVHMKRKRILFFLPFMNGGGAERVILTLLKHLNRKKYEPILVMLRKEGRYLPLIPDDIKVIDLQATQARYAIFKIIQVIKETQPDIVFTTLAYLNLIIAMLRPLFSKNIIFIARESNTVSVRNKREKYPRLFDWLYKKVYKNFDFIVTQAKFMRDDLIDNYGINRDKLVTIYNPVDIENIEKKAQQYIDGLSDDQYNLLAVGKLGYQKGFDMLLSIMTKLDERYHLTILGEGSDKEHLEQQIKKLHIADRVTLAGFSDNPYAYMKRADLFVLSSRYEGLPNVVLEANACELPVVAFDSPGGTAEIIDEGMNGFLVAPFDEKEFASTIEKARNFHFDKEAIMIETKENFAIEKIIKEYEKLFT